MNATCFPMSTQMLLCKQLGTWIRAKFLLVFPSISKSACLLYSSCQENNLFFLIVNKNENLGFVFISRLKTHVLLTWKLVKSKENSVLKNYTWEVWLFIWLVSYYEEQQKSKAKQPFSFRKDKCHASVFHDQRDEKIFSLLIFLHELYFHSSLKASSHKQLWNSCPCSI